MELNSVGVEIGRQVEHYTHQPPQMPANLKKQIHELWKTDVLEIYSLIDLNERFHQTESWLCLGRKNLAVAKRTSEGGWNVISHWRGDIQAVREVCSLSCHRLVIELKGDQVVTVRYTLRQSRAIGHIKYLLEQSLKQKSQVYVYEKSADEIYGDEILKPIKEAQASVTGHQMAVVWRLMMFLLPYRGRVALGIVGAVMMTLVSLLPAFLTGHIIDNVIKPFQGGKLSLSEAQQMIALTIATLVITYLLRELFAWVRLRTMSVIGEHVAADLRDRVYSHLHKLSLSYFSSKQTGSLISRVGSDTDRIWDFIAFGVVEVFTSILMLLSLAGVLIYLDWPLGLLVTLPVPLILWSIYKHGQRMQGLFLRVWRKWSHMTDCLSDAIPGVRVVKAFHREEHETNKFRVRNDDFLGECNNLHYTWSGFWPLLMLGIQTVVVLVWVFGAPRVLGHIEMFNQSGASVGLSPGTFIAFLLYLGMFVQPIEVIGQMARMVNRATSSAHRVFEVLDTEPQVVERKRPVVIEDFKGQVSFENVSFSYDGVRKVLKNLSFQVKAGEMIGLVGPSGSGKTTITHLLARFYDTDSGVVRIDGHDIRDLDIGEYRQKVGMVLQDPYLFHGSILDNIRYAKPEASLEEVIEAAKAANAHEFIGRLPHGYDTIVGERGQTLSGGERQRVSIARAILRNPSLLILDEATSSVDTETERKIQEALDRLVKGRTVFAIAHRLSTLAKADRLFVIDKGVMVEQGTHGELLQNPDGVYSKLVKMQQDLQATQIV